jgi:hypothetical protein
VLQDMQSLATRSTLVFGSPVPCLSSGSFMIHETVAYTGKT